MKTTTLYTLVFAVIILFATNTSAQNSKGKSMISNGFTMNFGIGGQRTLGFGLGTEFSFDIGNQWMLYTHESEKFGVGVHTSWLTLGYIPSDISDILSIRPFKTGVIGSVEIIENLAADVYLDAMPTFDIAMASDFSDGSVSWGVLAVPGIKLRYRQFAIGVETSLGSLRNVDDNAFNFAYKTTISRITLGVKF